MSDTPNAAVDPRDLESGLEMLLRRLSRLEDEQDRLRGENEALRAENAQLRQRGAQPQPAAQPYAAMPSPYTQPPHPGQPPYPGQPYAVPPAPAPIDDWSRDPDAGLRHAEQTFIDSTSVDPVTGRSRLPPPPPPPTPADYAANLDVGYVNQVTEEQLNKLPFGLVILDHSGNVLFYNETESRYSKFRVGRVTGKNFFREVAPCTQVREFEGRFRQFVRGELGRVTFFEFVFRFARGPQHVTIAFSAGRKRGQVNVMMMRKAPPTPRSSADAFTR